MARVAGNKKINKVSSAPKRIQIAENISISENNHTKLVKHLVDRLDFGRRVRDDNADKFEIIDREVAGYIKHTHEDQQREIDNRRGLGPKVTDQNLPFVVAQLDEAVTYIMSLLSPDDGMYQAISSKDKQDAAKAFAALMNKNAKIFSHYRHMARAVYEMLKYNIGGNMVEWREIIGTEIKNTAGGTAAEIETGVVFAGNAIDAIDPYNFIYDISVPVTEVNVRGEFFATVSVETKFRLKKMQANKELYGVERFLDTVTAFGSSYYRQRPDIRTDAVGARETDFVSILTMGVEKGVGVGAELVNYFGWIIPSDFGLTNSKNLEIWRIVLVNGVYIADAEQLTNAHGMLPVAVARPWDDGFENETKSFAELLIPLQRFASFQMNIHQRSARKALYGVTFYNTRFVPNLDTSDMESSKIPVNPAAQSQDFDIRKHVLQFRDTPDTNNTLNDIQATDSLMQKVLPTDMLRQVTDLERATRYQAASVVQAANRRNHKITKLINDQCYEKTRLMQMYNIYQFQESIKILDPQGTEVEVNPAEFRAANLEFDISDGLKGIDKLAITEAIKEIINMILQSQQGAAQTDIMALIDYFTSLLGEKTDFKQFKIKSPIDALPPEQKDLAFQLLQQFLAQQQGGGQQQAQQPGLAAAQ